MRCGASTESRRLLRFLLLWLRSLPTNPGGAIRSQPGWVLRQLKCTTSGSEYEVARERTHVRRGPGTGCKIELALRPCMTQPLWTQPRPTATLESSKCGDGQCATWHVTGAPARSGRL